MRLRRSRRAFNGSLLAGSFAALALASCSAARSGTTAAGGAQPASAGTPSVGLQPGQIAPDFALTTIDGKPIGSADFRAQKRPYILFFFATW